MLGRRIPRSRLDFVKSWLWPQRGFGGIVRYFKNRLARMKGSPHYLAAGFASGAAVSFLPLPGLHFIIGGILAFATRGSLIASALGTAIGNPWTFPFIWLGAFRLGRWLGIGDGDAASGVRLGERLEGVVADILEGRLKAAAVDSWPFLGPTFVGGAIIGVVVWALAYFVLRHVVSRHQVRRQAKKAEGRARWARAAARLTGPKEGKA